MAFSSRVPSQETLRTIFLSSFVPRECGLATFTEDVIGAVGVHGVSSCVAAMNRPGETFAYDKRVLLTIREDQPADYLAAAKQINRSGYDVLSVQHEFGIYGGVDCQHLLTLLDAVEIPVVTTLHTVVRKPSEAMRENLRQVARRSSAVVVMNSLAIEILATVYGVDASKVIMIHHGAPVPPRDRVHTVKADLRLHGHKVISTFGLLSSGKGLEYAIQAMPRIVKEHPETLYLVLGQTHPVVKQQEGERYREALKSQARELGVEQHVRFVDKYFTKTELIAYLMATDIYLTPYLNMEQVTSGTLAYAMACGRPLVSTPYLHAQFLLGEDRGLLVPPADPVRTAEACLTILDNPDLQARMERTNWRYGQTLIWPRIGQEYLRLFQQVTRVHAMPSTTYLQARLPA
ncbi:MAG TPA: glycosyltransferase family 4 protein [Armatimonadota bacterium]|jgi:glycosyltransferase involved in cell wall biosynthesis